MRRALTVAVAVVLVSIASGCTQIPTSGPVIGGNEVEPAGPRRPFIQVEAPPPQAGDTPVDIVDGFIEAMASYAPGYETARLFLTEDAGISWDTSTGITVYAGARPTIEAVGDDVRVKMSVSGRVGPDGTYVAADPGTAEEFLLRMEQVNGEWRIANPPDGIVIADFSFGREYEPHNVYFFDPGYNVLVPDPVYLPTKENAATLLAQRLLEGPSNWLAPAVHTAFPDGAELGVNAVPVEQGTATVELSADAGQATPEQRELMTAQLAWTLGELPEVQEVAVTSGRIPLPQGGEAVSPEDSTMARYDPAVLQADAPLYFVDDSGVASVTDGEAAPVQGVLGTMPGLREVAVNAGGNRAAVVTGSGRELRVATLGDDETGVLAQGVDLSSPAWDRTGLIWAVDHGVDGPGLVVARSDGERLEVAAPELEGRDVDRLAVSLDATRIALVVDGSAYVGCIVRDADAGAALRIENVRRIGPAGVAVDIAWTAPDNVVVLLETETQEPLPYVVGLSGRVAAPRGLAVDDATAVAAAPPGRRIVVETAAGVLLEQRSGNRWNEIATGRGAAYPG